MQRLSPWSVWRFGERGVPRSVSEILGAGLMSWELKGVLGILCAGVRPSQFWDGRSESMQQEQRRADGGGVEGCNSPKGSS